MRLRGRARSLGKLVEIRGREHLDAALAGGKGAILCGAHFGSYNCAFSLLHVSGSPVTSIGRWWWHLRARRVSRRAADVGLPLRQATRPNSSSLRSRLGVLRRMDQQFASRLEADLFLVHAPSVFDFRERDDMLFAYLSDSDSVNVTSIYEMYPIGWFSLKQHLADHGLDVKIVNVASLMLQYPGLDVRTAARPA